MKVSDLFTCEITGSVLIVALQKCINDTGQATVVNESQAAANPPFPSLLGASDATAITKKTTKFASVWITANSLRAML